MCCENFLLVFFIYHPPTSFKQLYSGPRNTLDGNLCYWSAYNHLLHSCSLCRDTVIVTFGVAFLWPDQNKIASDAPTQYIYIAIPSSHLKPPIAILLSFIRGFFLFSKGYDVEVDESCLTGEAVPIKKHAEGDLMLYAGTNVIKGGGTMLVTAVGTYTQQRMIFQLVAQNDDDVEKHFGMLLIKQYTQLNVISDLLTCTHTTGCITRVFRGVKRELLERESLNSRTVLQKRVRILAKRISIAGFAAALLCFLTFSLKFVIIEFGINRRLWDSSRDFSQLLQFVIVGTTVVVVAVPEGLPLAMYIVLSSFVKKMLKNGSVVRHLEICETMGVATTIWSEKTGILTTNLFTVVESYFMGTKYKVMPHISDLPEILVDTLKTNIAVNSSYASKLEMVWYLHLLYNYHIDHSC